MKTTLHPTRNKLPAKVRASSIALLNQELANLTDLHSQTLQAHWNVRGRHFYPLHKLFEQLADEVEEHLDEVAERATALGGTARGTIRQAAAASKVPEYPPVKELHDEEHLTALAERYGFCANAVRDGIEAASSAGDADTADLFTQISRTLDKALWFLEAHNK